MSAHTIADDETRAEKLARAPKVHWQTVLLWIGIVALFALALALRLYNLGLLYDRDSYDEGVYWQSLRAMSAGHPLYQQIFYSQPPVFLLSTSPFYVLFGSSPWSARFGVALLSLLGLVGIFLLGKALSGRVGAITALVILVADPFYLAQSQTLQAEATSTALGILAVGLAFLWWKHTDGFPGLLLAALTGITLALSILTKLLGVSCLVPIAFIWGARLWQDWQQGGAARFSSLRSIVMGIAAGLLTALLILLPFIGSFQAMYQSAITFHNDAGTLPQFADWPLHNASTMKHLLTSILALTALYGTGVAVYRRDWRIIPLLLWFFVTLSMLWRLVPLFHHHLVALIPPLLALAIMGIGTFPPTPRKLPTVSKITTTIALVLVLITVVLNGVGIQQYYRDGKIQASDPLVQEGARIAVDLQNAITPDQEVITDAQFIAGLAGRNTPPALVDTSLVRINSQYVTLSTLIQEASQPQVHAILFFTGRFYLPSVYAFHAWVTQHFHLLHNYGLGRELWVR